VADDHGASPSEILSASSRAQRIDIEIVGGLASRQHVWAEFQHFARCTLLRSHLPTANRPFSAVAPLN